MELLTCKEGIVPRKTGKRRHIPQRTCIACREILPKRSLIRIVRSQQGVVIDPSGKLAGRGAYLHQQRSCWEKGMKGALSTALKVEINPDEYEHLKTYFDSLPE